MRLEIKALSKSFGTNLVLKNLNFTAESGAALGLLGRNGAGKTTTIRIIMQVFPPDSGQVLLDGQPLRTETLSIGYLPEEKGLYPKFKIGHQLVYLGRLRDLSRSDSVAAVRYWLDRLSLADVWDKKLETLSKGNQQKIQLALALIADPQIVILDEPFSGLDPVNAQLLKTIVREQVAAGKIVLFSSHQMSYVEQFCDRVALLNDGEIILEGDLRTIKRDHARNRLLVTLAGGAAHTFEQIESWLNRQPSLRQHIQHLEPDSEGCLVHLTDQGSRAELLKQLSGQGYDIEQFRIAEPTLEQIFVERVGETHG